MIPITAVPDKAIVLYNDKQQKDCPSTERMSDLSTHLSYFHHINIPQQLGKHTFTMYIHVFQK